MIESSINSAGGAWGGKPFEGRKLPLHNNVIVPYSKWQKHHLSELQNYLNSFGASVLLDSFRGGHSDFSKSVLVGSFFQFVDHILSDPGILFLKKGVKEVKIRHDSVDLDGHVFDYCFSTNNIGLSEITKVDVDGAPLGRLFPEYDTSTSVHLRALINNNPALGRKPKYSEEVDSMFDRWGFVPLDTNKSNFLFIGRVRRSQKNLNISKIQNGSEVLHSQSPLIAASELNYYTQKRLQKLSLERLVRLSADSPFKLVENSDLMTVIDDLVGLDTL